jgi:hypothetical protein
MGLGMLVYNFMEGSLIIKNIKMFGILILIAVFGIIFGVRRVMSERRGEPAEDELSKLLRQKAGATAFYLSLYFWLALSYIYSTKDIDTESVIGRGIVGMAVIFMLSWLYYRFRGLKDS